MKSSVAVFVSLVASIGRAPYALGHESDIVVASAYTHPQAMVRVEGTRRLNLFCIGHGRPVVLFDAGTGGNTIDWRHVQGAIAASTEACSYDRAGYGFSDPATRRMDASNSVDDLQRLIAAARLPIPFVLVGHSIGGLYAALFAQRHRRELAGMVLVDPAFRGSDDPFLDKLPQAKATEVLDGQRGFVGGVKRCLDLARAHDMAGMRAAKPPCLDDPPNPDPSLHAALDRQDASASFYAANYSEIRDENPMKSDLSRDDAELGDARASLGSVPLVVLTGGRHPLPFADFTAADTALVFQAWKSGHDRLAARSSRGQSRLIADAGHYVQNDDPGAVIEAVDEVIGAARQHRQRSLAR